MPNFKLLSQYGTNAKTAKSDKFGGYLTAILYLKPGIKVCPGASKGCLAACLNTAGRGAMTNVQQARARKTKLFFTDQAAFLELLRDDLRRHQAYCEKRGVKPVARLNGTSDIDWNALGIIDEFPEIQFYDYTKRLEFTKYSKKPNYHVTISRTEETRDGSVQFYAKHGHNVAVVFSGPLPQRFLGVPVVSGDETDLRFLDPSGVVVGLTVKGRGKKDKSGFVVHSETDRRAS